jgi:hypothetical protein
MITTLLIGAVGALLASDFLTGLSGQSASIAPPGGTQKPPAAQNPQGLDMNMLMMMAMMSGNSWMPLLMMAMQGGEDSLVSSVLGMFGGG